MIFGRSEAINKFKSQITASLVFKDAINNIKHQVRKRAKLYSTKIVRQLHGQLVFFDAFNRDNFDEPQIIEETETFENE